MAKGVRKDHVRKTSSFEEGVHPYDMRKDTVLTLIGKMQRRRGYPSS